MRTRWVSTPNETTRQHGRHPTLALLTLWLVGYGLFEMVAIEWVVFAGGQWRGGGELSNERGASEHRDRESVPR